MWPLEASTTYALVSPCLPSPSVGSDSYLWGFEQKTKFMQQYCKAHFEKADLIICYDNLLIKQQD